MNIDRKSTSIKPEKLRKMRALRKIVHYTFHKIKTHFHIFQALKSLRGSGSVKVGTDEVVKITTPRGVREFEVLEISFR